MTAFAQIIGQSSPRQDHRPRVDGEAQMKVSKKKGKDGKMGWEERPVAIRIREQLVERGFFCIPGLVDVAQRRDHFRRESVKSLSRAAPPPTPMTKEIG